MLRLRVSSHLAIISILSLPRIAFSTARAGSSAMSVDGDCVEVPMAKVESTEYPGTAVERLRGAPGSGKTGGNTASLE